MVTLWLDLGRDMCISDRCAGGVAAISSGGVSGEGLEPALENSRLIGCAGMFDSESRRGDRGTASPSFLTWVGWVVDFVTLAMLITEGWPELNLRPFAPPERFAGGFVPGFRFFLFSFSENI